ncbi:hypothetical protein SOVF_065730 isoform C [Spinacia oleracea]|nr:hypothetical protein SOVF_065730 isoform C [Spinacia oleracea]
MEIKDVGSSSQGGHTAGDAGIYMGNYILWSSLTKCLQKRQMISKAAR